MTEQNRGEKQTKPALWLIPNTLGFMKTNTILAEEAIKKIHTVKYFLAESRQSAFRFLKWIKHPLQDYEITLEILNKGTKEIEIPELMKALKEGNSMGVISEAGIPGVADPGNLAVRWAHTNNIKVIPLSGPSSLVLALAASGLNGQKFTFHGYLPDQPAELKKKLLDLERISRAEKSTQLFIEAPHKNDTTIDILLETLHPTTLLCVACHLTLEDEFVLTKPVSVWRTLTIPEIQKKPTVFLFQSQF